MNESNGQYKFNLRKDMPRGFKDNKRFPELPAILEHLHPYVGQIFQSPDTFQKDVLDPFLAYLHEKNIPSGTDPLLRQGLRVAQLPQRFEDMAVGVWDYEVFTPADNAPGTCVFGGLEKITN